MRKVVGIMCSPRKGGNADLLLGRALEGARSKGAGVRKIVLNDLDFMACQECGGCDKTGVCVLKDDMRSVYKEIEGADGVIISSPVFFGTVSAQMKMMIDRFNCLWIKKYVLKEYAHVRKRRKGLFLCVSASDKEEFFENSRKAVRIFFATIGADYSGDVFCGGVEKKAAIKKNKACLNKAFRLGAVLAAE
ncbi:MAG: flavodoxin family protein [Candidatus Omnitrophota bacterium]|nr:flavodoxin family protein [Candidatus Omnitrophota bacterium]